MDLFLRCILFLQLQPKPRIDYILKAVGGSLTAMPGLSDMIDVYNKFSFPFLFSFSLRRTICMCASSTNNTKN